MCFSFAVRDDGRHIVRLAVAGVGQTGQRQLVDGRVQRTTVVDDRAAGAGKSLVAHTVRAVGGRGGPQTVSADDRAAVHRQLADGVGQQYDRRAVLGAAAAGRVHRHHHDGGAHLHR